ncbi:hypothetical protein SEVIR_5G060700v4 [Setaria viridis]|uniref:MFS18 protein n=1 Tax=Setaria viridis TaxID=4556 RepID=A0A4U6UFG7_SETVI|nr:MFS18 protein-like [Setaria viridis]TKW12833.1 hypothetical protein SEVIR_5G060700v2 [Setaria viridis]
MARSAKMMAAAALLVLAVAAATTAEARNIKTAEKKDDAVVQPQTFPPFDRLGGGLPGAGGSSIPGFSMPGSGGLTPGFSLPGSGSIGSMPLFGGGGSPFSGFGGMPGSPAAGGSVPEHSNKP